MYQIHILKVYLLRARQLTRLSQFCHQSSQRRHKMFLSPQHIYQQRFQFPPPTHLPPPLTPHTLTSLYDAVVERDLGGL